MLRTLFAIDSPIGFTLQRILEAIPSVIAVVTLGFVLINFAPGDPAFYIIGEGGDPELIEQIRARLGLDAPLHVRYWTYISGVFQGQLGRSFVFNRPVVDIIQGRISATLILFTAQFFISTFLGVVAGAVAAYKRGSLWDKVTIAGSVLWYSIPVFWSGQLLIILLALRLDLFPPYGMRGIQAPTEGLGQTLDLFRHLFLPALTLALLNMALIARIARSSMLEALQEDYIITARSKGLSKRRVVIRHALRNALLPVVTVLGLVLGRIMSGSVLVETVFNWPGLGRLMYDSILMRDYPVVLGLFLVISVMVIVANLLTDIAYGLLDPRVRYGKA